MMRRLKKISDEELLELFRNGDEAAFEELYNRYWAELYASAFKRLRIKEAAEEIVQDLFTSLWTKRDSLVIHTSLQNYLYSSIRYLVFAYFRKQDNRKTYEDFVLGGPISGDTSTEDRIYLNDLERNLDQGLRRLPQKCRSVFELSRKQYKTNKEIASFLGISEKTVENHLTKALRTLRLHLRYLNVLLFITLTCIR
ncbi:RNA polymerase sigma-70 factor [Arcticibacter sp. MXS-1]|uniref:RNA polymerase sigma-70 factor n=1 Tax=Arcticibacter sp. MXS-1 TaxID=3341726 RepID=UPI0035A983E6